jgi:Tfp pilus assembly PilM family ATPase
VVLEQRGDVWTLCRYALLDAPIFDKKISSELLAEHLKAVLQALETDAKYLTLSVSLDDAVVRQLELPNIPVDEMRMVLKNNTKGYLQQDLPGYVFDCYIFPPKQVPPGQTPEASKTAGVAKAKVLVTGAKQQLMNDYQAAIKEAGLVADYIVPGLVGPINAFEMALPEVYNNETVALVDIGFKHTSVCLLDRGELALMRVVNIGGDKITAGLAEMMSISYAEAEGIKVGMAPEVQSALEMQVLPLGRELRASLDFFEHQNDRPVTQVYVSGGSARSEMILEILRAELIVECNTWNPTRFLQLALPGQQSVELEHVGSQLAVAVGAAMMAL